MNTEQKLNQLFETLKSEKPVTNISDVTNWIEGRNVIIKANKVNKLTIKKIIIMSSILTTGIICTITFFSNHNTETKDKKHNQVSIEKNRINTYDTAKNKEIELVNEQPLKQNQISIESNMRKDFNKDSSGKNEIKNQPCTEDDKTYENSNLQSNSLINSIEKVNNPVSKKEKGLWRSFNDTLKVDTLFNGVKALIFTGDYNDQIVIKGTKRSNLSMHYNYCLKAKGVFIKNPEQICELSYILKDSILTVNLDRKKSKISIGIVSVITERNQIEFEVPENLDAQITAGYGDIEASGLINKVKLHSSYGDMKADNISGIIDCNTNYGDIILKNSKGKLKLNTAYGDITTNETSGDIDLKTMYGDVSTNNSQGKLNIYTGHGDVSGKSILIEELGLIKTVYGQIDLEIVNPISDFTMDLKTQFGKTKVDRADMKLKSENRLQTGTGSLKLNVETEYGAIKIR